VHHIVKVVVITERILLDRVAGVLERCGATGYTYVAAGGKGARGKRTAASRAQVSGLSTNVKIEALVADRAKAEAICDAVAEEFFEDYSGITYLEPVEVLRPHKF